MAVDCHGGWGGSDSRIPDAVGNWNPDGTSPTLSAALSSKCLLPYKRHRAQVTHLTVLLQYPGKCFKGQPHTFARFRVMEEPLVVKASISEIFVLRQVKSVC